MSMASNMKQISLEKVVINIGVGKSGEPLERAKNALEELTSRKPTQCSAKNNVRDFGIHKGEPIGAKVTLRNTEALEFTKRIIESKSNKLQKSSFDNYGNISIGIREHIDIPGAKYNPDIGIFGMNVCISLSRPGYRILNKSNPRKLGKKHRISKYEAIEFFENLGVEMV
ncbi:MAG: 50S ribosomal protein L5 [Thaumarchaeota archaeon]|nr:MAG: 50S ribosomal protein L5 [Nitrososphaerota archaeon]